MESKPIPGPFALPLIGNIFSLDRNHMQRTFYQWMKEYGPVFKFSFFGQDVVVLGESKSMREIFTVLDHRPILPQSVINYNNSGAGFTNFDEHRKLVKDITFQIYHDTYKDPYIAKLQDELLDEFIDGLISQDKGVTDIDTTVLRFICTQYCVEQTGRKPSPEVVDTIITYLLEFGIGLVSKGRPFLLYKYPWLTKIPGSFKKIAQDASYHLHNVVRVLSEEAKKSYTEGEEHGMIQNFLKRKEQENKNVGNEVVTDENMYASIIAETILLGPGGTTRAISSVIMYMLIYQDHQMKVRESLEKFKGIKRLEDLVEEDLPYLTAFIIESMRMNSSIFLTIPHLVQEDTVIAGFQFKKDQMVSGCTSNVHLDEKTWGDPFEFRPERFLDPSGQLVPESHPLRQAWVPFGVGARYCKGRNTAWNKIFKYVTRILYKCDIKKVNDSQQLPTGDPRDFQSVVALIPPKFDSLFVERK